MKDIGLLFERSNIIRRVREFFYGRNYLELDTPVLSPELIPETCLEVFKTELLSGEAGRPGAPEGKRELYLVPSPEIWMKKFISEKKHDVFQVCRCFRNCEASGLAHSPEFTMLEYYTMGFDYLDSISLTEELFDFLLEDEGLLDFQSGEELESVKPPFERLTMEEAFVRFAGFSPGGAVRDGTLLREARRLGLDPPENADEEVLYNLIFVHRVENSLPRERPVALLDYPAIVPCLAKDKPPLYKERWELYVRGVETANCYSEETDADKVREYFENEGRLKNERCKVRHKTDADYWKYFSDFPECSGVALGLDRLIMCLLGKKTIDGVLPFPAAR